jgi:hypothetical protein
VQSVCVTLTWARAAGDAVCAHDAAIGDARALQAGGRPREGGVPRPPARPVAIAREAFEGARPGFGRARWTGLWAEESPCDTLLEAGCAAETYADVLLLG